MQSKQGAKEGRGVGDRGTRFPLIREPPAMRQPSVHMSAGCKAAEAEVAGCEEAWENTGLQAIVAHRSTTSSVRKRNYAAFSSWRSAMKRTGGTVMSWLTTMKVG